MALEVFDPPVEFQGHKLQLPSAGAPQLADRLELADETYLGKINSGDGVLTLLSGDPDPVPSIKE